MVETKESPDKVSYSNFNKHCTFNTIS